MWPHVILLIVIVVLVGWTVFINWRPITCPSCTRINVFRRAKTGQRRDVLDDEGDLRRRLTEYVCRRCGVRYWIVWDDFEKSTAMLSADVNADTDARAHPIKPKN
jgi:hypothetical protein